MKTFVFRGLHKGRPRSRGGGGGGSQNWTNSDKGRGGSGQSGRPFQSTSIRGTKNPKATTIGKKKSKFAFTSM